MNFHYIISEELSKEDKVRFRKLIQKFHPDKGTDSDEELTKKLIKAKKKEDTEYIRRLYKKYFSDKKQEQKTSKDTKKELPRFMYWAERVADEYNVHSIVKRMENGEIVINFFKSGGNFQTMFNAERYDTWDTFYKAAKRTIKRL